MSTKLESIVVRETNELIGERNICVALTTDNRVSLRLKGLKTGGVSISIKELWETLNNLKPKTQSISTPANTLIPIDRLRVRNAISPISMEAKVLIDEMIVDIINEQKNAK